jgi:tetratricopeptide (TPR) repeat protein
VEKNKPKIFLKREEIKVGFGSTARTTRIENYFEAVEDGDGRILMYLLNIQDQRIGQPIEVSKENLKDYIHCPDYFDKKGDPSKHSAQLHVQLGDQYYDKQKFYSAQFEYGRALQLEEDHLQANFGMAKTLFALGEKEKAKKYFLKLSSMDALFEKENKHIFNELGIEMRKRGMLEEAIAHYQKALSIDPGDAVLYYNLARAYYEKGDWAKTLEQLRVALSIDPNFEEAKDFLSFIEFSWGS